MSTQLQTAAEKLGDTAYKEYLNEVIFRLSDVELTRDQASGVVGPALQALRMLNHTLGVIGIRNTERLFNLGVGDLAATEGVGDRQIEVALVILDRRGWDVDDFLKNFEGKSWRSKTRAAVKKGTKRKARDRGNKRK